MIKLGAGLLPVLVTLTVLGVAPGLVGAQSLSRPAFSDAHVHLNSPVVWVRLMDEAGVAPLAGTHLAFSFREPGTPRVQSGLAD